MRVRLWGLVMIFAAVAGCHKQPSLKAVKAVPTTVESTVTTISSGTVAAEQQAVLGFGVVGRVSKIHVKVGEKVAEGQVIAELENTDLEAVLRDATKELNRAKQLLREGLVSKVARDDARRAYEVARANLDRSVIRAPFAGLISEMNLELGELAQTTSPVARPAVRLIDLKPRLVKGDIDEIDLAKVKQGFEARVRVPAARQDPFKGIVTRVVPFVDTTKEQDRTSQIELRISEAEQLIPVGASAEVEIIVGKKEGALAVPSRVVLGSGDERYVYRVQDERVHRVPVKLGLGNYDRSEIISGLSAGDIVVYPTDEVELTDNLKVKTTLQPWP